jgi:transcriptional regulator with XRE-family HTH domain
MADLAKQVGKRVKMIRKTAKLTQEQLAEKAGLSVEFISRMERGTTQPSFKTISSLAAVLNVSAKDFFDFGGHIVFRDKRQEAKKKKDYLDAIATDCKDMDTARLAVVYDVAKALKSRS